MFGVYKNIHIYIDEVILIIIMADEKLVPKLRFNFEDEWKNVKLDDLTEKISSGKSNLKKSTDENEKYPIYGSRGVIGYASSYDYDDNYLLIARVGANAGSLFKISGKCGITDNTLILKTNDLINDDYLFYYLKNYNLNRLVFGSGQPLITGKQLKKIEINLPNIKEQNKISKMFIDVENNINSLNKSINLVLNFKKRFTPTNVYLALLSTTF